jgi:hypothetical protein
MPSLTAGRVDGLTVQLVSPTNLGTPANPISLNQATVNLIARDDQGQQWPNDITVDVFVSFGGVKEGMVTGCGGTLTPLETVTLPGGALMGHTLTLPQAYGPTTIWVEDPVSGTAGASDIIYSRNPYIADIQTPPDLTATDAAYCTPFSNKFLIVDHAQNGGQLVVTSMFINAIAITDTGATNGFNSIYLYTFGAPPSNVGPGSVIQSFSGNISKFVGFTEVNFPIINPVDPPMFATLPVPTPVTITDISNVPKLLSLVASPVTTSGKICDVSTADPTANKQWASYKSFVVTGGASCDAFGNFAVQLPANRVGDLDPPNQFGRTLTVTGMLQNNSGAGSGGTPFNFWTIQVRQASDVILQ